MNVNTSEVLINADVKSVRIDIREEIISCYERSDFMKHYLKSKDGEIKYTVDMYCEHPNMKNWQNI